MNRPLHRCKSDASFSMQSLLSITSRGSYRICNVLDTFKSEPLLLWSLSLQKVLHGHLHTSGSHITFNFIELDMVLQQALVTPLPLRNFPSLSLLTLQKSHSIMKCPCLSESVFWMMKEGEGGLQQNTGGKNKKTATFYMQSSSQYFLDPTYCDHIARKNMNWKNKWVAFMCSLQT